VLSGDLNLAGSDLQQCLTVHDKPRHSDDATGVSRAAPPCRG
jgi:hypothetical protein